MTCENANLSTEAHIRVGSFDRAQELRPRGHLYREEQLSWLHLAKE